MIVDDFAALEAAREAAVAFLAFALGLLIVIAAVDLRAILDRSIERGK